MSLSIPALIAGISLVIMTILAIFVFPALQPTPAYIAGVAVIILLDVIIAVALYMLMKPAGNLLAAGMSVSRLLYAGVFIYALVNITDLESFYSIWDPGFILFGIHLVLLGYLIYRSGYIPKWLGILVVIAGAGYLVDSVAAIAGYDTQVGIFTFFGEVLLGVWLVIKGRTLTS